MNVQKAAVAAMMVGAAVALAAPAQAEPSLEGTYQAVLTNATGGTLEQEWVFTSCGPTCARRAGDGVEFHLEGTNWTAVQAAGTTNIDAASLAGTWDMGAVGRIPVQLTRIG